jgi:rare lipoprotein A
MKKASSVFPPLMGLALVLLVGCDDDGQFAALQALQPSNPYTQARTNSGALVKTVERSVEAPDVFTTTELGLWDGRPSLGGVWVAHPDVNEPEQVIIRNLENNKFVVGALFLRARNIPGPRIQISSDAAEALDMRAGAPATLNVTALRKEQPVVSPKGFDPQQSKTIEEPDAIAANTLDPISAAASALDMPAAPSAASRAQNVPTNVAPKPRSSTLVSDKPFIQVGIFSVEANAQRTATQMRNAGIIPTIKSFDRNGKPFWRVVIGPAATIGERAQLLDQIKGEGFTDAYAVTN